MKDRRKLLKALSITGAVAAVESWKKPLINAVVLPAHAQTSPSESSYQVCFRVQATITGTWIGNREMIIADQKCSAPPIYEQTVDWSAGVFDEQLCTNLEPGIYTIDFTAGAGAPANTGDMGAASIVISAQLECSGNVLWSDSASETGTNSIGGEGIGECGILTIEQDGTCSFDDNSCCLDDD